MLKKKTTSAIFDVIQGFHSGLILAKNNPIFFFFISIKFLLFKDVPHLKQRFKYIFIFASSKAILKTPI